MYQEVLVQKVRQKNNLTALIELVASFLRKYGITQGLPVFEAEKTELVCIDQRGMSDELYGIYPFWQPRKTDVLKKDFESIDSLVEATDYETVQKRALREIPDSKDTVIIEIGSASGVNGAGYIAKYKPKSQVILVSKPENNAVILPYLFNPRRPGKHRIVFEKGQNEFVLMPETSRFVNALYKLNGINNVALYDHKLAVGETGMKLPRFLSEVLGKDIYLFGYRVPGELGFVVSSLYKTMNAKQMTISMTAPEIIRPESFVWKAMEIFGLEKDEIKGLISVTYDPSQRHIELPRFDYSREGERRIGTVIKLALALSLAVQTGGEVLRNAEEKSRSWNQIDYYIRANRSTR